ncbi:hypothetical protein K466DRAFT_585527 [Polyporus arcularius HHB13444]|uniref:Uncharacterized protein n=1 Tax=Polyporus arcularius HHB13444 TaxID=1314778 RepID=A0A5C3PHW3_9APHY|nr:hypothetical protein K466DRAFT_585527 [Polyporus arcularius HHB13444]
MATTSTEQNSTTRPDDLAEKFPSFDHRAQVVSPFEQELKRDAQFIEELNAMLLELVIDFHAWSAARPVFESDKTADVLEKEVKSLVDTEKEQEKTRLLLNEFIARIKLAIAALTGLAPL